ncbi:nucleolar protein 12-domain-containing protein [Dichotomocladium elegans]|nr:nucleolar protein 12-domain-containing protein [Dichotomocladium elegans]
MSPKAKKISNTEILTAGAKVYAKKRKSKAQRVERIDFDPDSRKEFLTGFHKRKVERKKKAKEKYEERLRQEKIKERASLRAQRKWQVQQKMDEMDAMMKGQLSDDEEKAETVFTKDEEESTKAKEEPIVKEFKSEATLTTVTVIEDMDDWGKDI